MRLGEFIDYFFGRTQFVGERQSFTLPASQNSELDTTTMRNLRLVNTAGSGSAEVAMMPRQRSVSESRTEPKVKALENELERYKQKVQRRDNRIVQLQRGHGASRNPGEVAEAEQQLTESAKKLKELTTEREKNKALAANNAALQQELLRIRHQAGQEIAALQKECKDQGDLLKGAQEDVFKSKDVSDTVIESDEAINATLSSIERASVSFCKQHAVKTKGVFSLSLIFEASEHAAAQIVGQPGMKALESARMDKSAPGLLLSAWLAHEIHQRIISEPFFFLNELEYNLFVDKETHIALGMSRLLSLVKWFHGQDNKSINIMSSEIFKLLNLHQSEKQTHNSPDKDWIPQAVEAAKGVACAKIAVKFLSKAHKLVVPCENNDMTREVVDILMDAAEASKKLYVQRCRIVISGLPNIEKKFSKNSKDLAAHYTYDFDEDAESLEGKEVLLVTSPEVTANGSSDGSDMTTVRVLKKATVWMGKL